MANKNVIFTDGNDNVLYPYTTAEQIDYCGVNVSQELKRIEAIIEQYE
jgi:hypothetical protein